MTTMIAWMVYDQRRASSFYIATDSRITWGSKAHRWDAGRKIFSSSKFPDIFGYAGDVIFPCLCLSQIVDSLDHGVLATDDSTSEERANIVFEAVKRSYERRHQAADVSFKIFHASRTGILGNAKFFLWEIIFDAQTKSWAHHPRTIPASTGIVAEAGSGAYAARQNAEKWIKHQNPGISRSIFSAFCEAIEKQIDPLSGGSPQLAGIYLKGAAVSFGILHNGQPFLHGLPVVNNLSSGKLEWRDRLLQRIDGKTLKLIPGAQRHARPSTLESS